VGHRFADQRFFPALIDVARAVSSDGCANVSRNVQYTLGTFFFQQNREFFPQLLGTRRGISQKAVVAGVFGVVLLDKSANIDFILPFAAGEITPGFETYSLQVRSWWCSSFAETVF